MTAARPNDTGNGERRRRRRRWIALIAILSLIAFAALLTPELMGGRSGDQRLTTYSADPQGARLLYELAARLGWHVERGTADSLAADRRTVMAILDPAQPLAGIEAHKVLERVRAGSALLYVMSMSSPLNDSLHVKRSLNGGTYVPTSAGTSDAPRPARSSDSLRAHRFNVGASTGQTPDTERVDSSSADDELAGVECAGKPPNGGALPLWGDEVVHLWRLSWTRSRPADAVIFARAAIESGQRDSGLSQPAAVGFGVGRGRVVVISDPDQLRNDVLRVCHWGLDVVAVRMLEYLASGNPQARDRLVFDEYHQGFGAHPGTLHAIALYLARTPSGHVLLQCMLAGLVLLLALGPRAVPAYDPERVERRSPLEHVGALARAYARVGATRTATARLLHGVRRRLERSRATGTPGLTAAAFLDAVVRVKPDLGDDVARIRRALEIPITPRELGSVGEALSRLEQSLQTERR